MSSTYDRFRSFLRIAASTANDFVASDDGKKLIDKVTKLSARVLSDVTQDVLAGKTPRLVETVKNGLQYTDPGDRSKVIADKERYELRMADARFIRERDAAEEAHYVEMQDFLAIEDAESAHDKKQDLFIAQQSRFDSEVNDAISAINTSAGSRTEQQKKVVRALQKAIVGIKNHLVNSEKVTKQLATASAVKAATDTAGDFVEAIPVLGAIIKGIADAGTTAATIAETAIAYNAPDYHTLNSAVTEMNNEIEKQLVVALPKIDQPITDSQLSTVFEKSVEAARADIFRINRPHYNENDANERESYAAWASRFEEGMAGWSCLTPQISDSSVIMFQYIPKKGDLYHIFIIFDVNVQDVVMEIREVTDPNGIVVTAPYARDTVWSAYARARDEVLSGKTQLRLTSAMQRDSSLLGGTYGLGLAYITWLGTGKNGTAAMQRAETLMKYKDELMHHRTSQEFRSIIAAILMGSYKVLL